MAKITGTASNDLLYGTDAIDIYKGLGGDDKFVWSKGNDLVYGGDGWDTMSYYHYIGDVTVKLAGGGRGAAIGSLGDTKYLYSIEAVILGNGSDVATGDSGANTFFGRGGDDRFIYSPGEDIMYGDDGWDTLDYFAYAGNLTIKMNGEKIGTVKASDGDLQYFYSIEAIILGRGNDVLTGDAGTNSIWGGAGNDNINGGKGNDILDGGSGNDVLRGNIGADRLTGGKGADQFIFKSIGESTVGASGRDFITDFSRSQGDKIDLSAIDARTATSKNDAFTFIGEKAFSDKAGELRYFHKSGDTFVSGDVDGDGKADFALRLDKTIDLVKGDFIL
ncbi:type I secretion C-terminal target domain-containing protein [Shinella curvata]|uniref:Type I secretion C-terminal target domain-containing protein n=1 Tax=Shinella curvata TaxID=1817964 RepID=A0ABT8X919_9HYPH|nr:calcium-binding protein [Shinella curvata]MCJ8051847.1 type I secretion C-terminal target domain-containing protein [Shinella curvata]MDO6120205.1 type I secretion C-terminal target domain-containing protein [Shinella curvata]